jgi:ferrochelatase
MAAALNPAHYDQGGKKYDAVLVLSFGGPEGPDDVMPFLDNVFRGLRVTDETKQKIAGRYQTFGGISPINGHTRDFIDALGRELSGQGPNLPIYWGNRNWHPMLRDTIEQMTADGIGRAVVYVTSTFSSYSGCRKYREDLFDACDGLAGAPELDKLRVGFNHPGFIDAMAARVADALERAGGEDPAAARVLFTAHSLPESMAAQSPYVDQLDDACRSIAARLGLQNWALVFQSNNARYGGEPWLGPDIAEAIEHESRNGLKQVVVAPVGFVCDHMEVVLDLDVDAAKRARELGVEMIRAATVGTHPAYVSMVRELIEERMSTDPARRTEGALAPKHDFCPADCCLSGRPGPARPSLCGSAEPAYSEERSAS